jgi:hypothetical protein
MKMTVKVFIINFLSNLERKIKVQEEDKDKDCMNKCNKELLSVKIHILLMKEVD